MHNCSKLNQSPLEDMSGICEWMVAPACGEENSLETINESYTTTFPMNYFAKWSDWPWGTPLIKSL